MLPTIPTPKCNISLTNTIQTTNQLFQLFNLEPILIFKTALRTFSTKQSTPITTNPILKSTLQRKSSLIKSQSKIYTNQTRRILNPNPPQQQLHYHPHQHNLLPTSTILRHNNKNIKSSRIRQLNINHNNNNKPQFYQSHRRFATEQNPKPTPPPSSTTTQSSIEQLQAKLYPPTQQQLEPTTTLYFSQIKTFFQQIRTIYDKLPKPIKMIFTFALKSFRLVIRLILLFFLISTTWGTIYSIQQPSTKDVWSFILNMRSDPEIMKYYNNLQLSLEEFEIDLGIDPTERIQKTLPIQPLPKEMLPHPDDDDEQLQMKEDFGKLWLEANEATLAQWNDPEQRAKLESEGKVFPRPVLNLESVDIGQLINDCIENCNDTNALIAKQNLFRQLLMKECYAVRLDLHDMKLMMLRFERATQSIQNKLKTRFNFKTQPIKQRTHYLISPNPQLPPEIQAEVDSQRKQVKELKQIYEEAVLNKERVGLLLLKDRDNEDILREYQQASKYVAFATRSLTTGVRSQVKYELEQKQKYEREILDISDLDYLLKQIDDTIIASKDVQNGMKSLNRITSVIEFTHCSNVNVLPDNLITNFALAAPVIYDLLDKYRDVSSTTLLYWTLQCENIEFFDQALDLLLAQHEEHNIPFDQRIYERGCIVVPHKDPYEHTILEETTNIPHLVAYLPLITFGFQDAIKQYQDREERLIRQEEEELLRRVRINEQWKLEKRLRAGYSLLNERAGALNDDEVLLKHMDRFQKRQEVVLQAQLDAQKKHAKLMKKQAKLRKRQQKEMEKRLKNGVDFGPQSLTPEDLEELANDEDEDDDDDDDDDDQNDNKPLTREEYILQLEEQAKMFVLWLRPRKIQSYIDHLEKTTPPSKDYHGRHKRIEAEAIARVLAEEQDIKQRAIKRRQEEENNNQNNQNKQDDYYDDGIKYEDIPGYQPYEIDAVLYADDPSFTPQSKHSKIPKTLTQNFNDNNDAKSLISHPKGFDFDDDDDRPILPAPTLQQQEALRRIEQLHQYALTSKDAQSPIDYSVLPYERDHRTHIQNRIDPERLQDANQDSVTHQILSSVLLDPSTTRVGIPLQSQLHVSMFNDTVLHELEKSARLKAIQTRTILERFPKQEDRLKLKQMQSLLPPNDRLIIELDNDGNPIQSVDDIIIELERTIRNLPYQDDQTFTFFPLLCGKYNSVPRVPFRPTEIYGEILDLANCTKLVEQTDEQRRIARDKFIEEEEMLRKKQFDALAQQYIRKRIQQLFLLDDDENQSLSERLSSSSSDTETQKKLMLFDPNKNPIEYEYITKRLAEQKKGISVSSIKSDPNIQYSSDGKTIDPISFLTVPKLLDIPTIIDPDTGEELSLSEIDPVSAKLQQLRLEESFIAREIEQESKITNRSKYFENQLKEFQEILSNSSKSITKTLLKHSQYQADQIAKFREPLLRPLRIELDEPQVDPVTGQVINSALSSGLSYRTAAEKLEDERRENERIEAMKNILRTKFLRDQPLTFIQRWLFSSKDIDEHYNLNDINNIETLYSEFVLGLDNIRLDTLPGGSEDVLSQALFNIPADPKSDPTKGLTEDEIDRPLQNLHYYSFGGGRLQEAGELPILPFSNVETILETTTRDERRQLREEKRNKIRQEREQLRKEKQRQLFGDNIDPKIIEEFENQLLTTTRSYDSFPFNQDGNNNSDIIDQDTLIKFKDLFSKTTDDDNIPLTDDEDQDEYLELEEELQRFAKLSNEERLAEARIFFADDPDLEELLAIIDSTNPDSPYHTPNTTVTGTLLANTFNRQPKIEQQTTINQKAFDELMARLQGNSANNKQQLQQQQGHQWDTMYDTMPILKDVDNTVNTVMNTNAYNPFDIKAKSRRGVDSAIQQFTSTTLPKELEQQFSQVFDDSVVQFDELQKVLNKNNELFDPNQTTLSSTTSKSPLTTQDKKEYESFFKPTSKPSRINQFSSEYQSSLTNTSSNSSTPLLTKMPLDSLVPADSILPDTSPTRNRALKRQESRLHTQQQYLDEQFSLDNKHRVIKEVERIKRGEITLSNVPRELRMHVQAQLELDRSVGNSLSDANNQRLELLNEVRSRS